MILLFPAVFLNFLRLYHFFHRLFFLLVFSLIVCSLCLGLLQYTTVPVMSYSLFSTYFLNLLTFLYSLTVTSFIILYYFTFLLNMLSCDIKKWNFSIYSIYMNCKSQTFRTISSGGGGGMMVYHWSNFWSVSIGQQNTKQL